jgi:hypothetical protein
MDWEGGSQSAFTARKRIFPQLQHRLNMISTDRAIWIHVEHVWRELSALEDDATAALLADAAADQRRSIE